jgi:ABC-2 type transport system permease protein
MPEVASHAPPQVHERSFSPLRPPAWLSVTIDAGLGCCSYLAAYWLRFQGGELSAFLPGAWSTLPFVVSGQVAGLAAMRAYAPSPRVEWLLRVIGGIGAGTLAAMLVLLKTRGFEGASRGAVAAAAVLLGIAAVGWRGVWVLAARASHLRPVEQGELIDRATGMTTIGGVVASLYAYRELLRNLVLKDLKLKYRGSVFGFLWSLANPLLMMIVYTVAFTVILRIRNEGFVFSLMLGLLSWTFFSSSATMATGSIVENSGLLRSVLFPRAILPISTVLFNLSQFLLTIAVFLPLMMLWYRVPPGAPMLVLPVFLALQVVLTIGIALLLSTMTAFFRDVRHLLEIALAIMFWTTPIVYELIQVPEKLRLLILLSPVSPFVVAYQQILYYRVWPEATIWLVALAHAFGAFVAGAIVFLAFEDRLAEL